MQSRLHTDGPKRRPGSVVPAALARRLQAVETVAFDLDSTLVDFMQWKTRACEAAVRALVDAGVDVPASGNGHVPEAILVERLLDTYKEIGVESDVAIEEFLSRVGVPPDPALTAIGVSGYIRGKEAALDPYPRTVPTLVQLLRRGLRLAVVTDAPRAKALQRLAATRLLPFFDTVVTRDDAGGGKDSGRPYQELLRRLQAVPSCVLMVGDWPEKDVRVPRQMGMVTAWARYGAKGVGASVREDDRPDVVLDRIDDLTRILDNADVEGRTRP